MHLEPPAVAMLGRHKCGVNEERHIRQHNAFFDFGRFQQQRGVAGVSVCVLLHKLVDCAIFQSKIALVQGQCVHCCVCQPVLTWLVDGSAPRVYNYLVI